MEILNLEKQGESLTFFGPADSSAPSVEFEMRLAPGGEGPPPHVHPVQTETFTVVFGTLVVAVEGVEQTIGAGDVLEVQPGEVHTFRNGSPKEPVVSRVTVEPALNFQWMLVEGAKSAIRGDGSWKGASLLESGYIAFHARQEYRMAGLPLLAQDVLFGSLAWLARILGKTKQIAPLDGAPAPSEEVLQASA